MKTSSSSLSLNAILKNSALKTKLHQERMLHIYIIIIIIIIIIILFFLLFFFKKESL